jgi:hypothetical protein
MYQSGTYLTTDSRIRPIPFFDKELEHFAPFSSIKLGWFKGVGGYFARPGISVKVTMEPLRPQSHQIALNPHL